jgi:hypothetical protein
MEIKLGGLRYVYFGKPIFLLAITVTEIIPHLRQNIADYRARIVTDLEQAGKGTHPKALCLGLSFEGKVVERYIENFYKQRPDLAIAPKWERTNIPCTHSDLAKAVLVLNWAIDGAYGELDKESKKFLSDILSHNLIKQLK